MPATTYDLITESNGIAVLKCLLCSGESSNSDDVQRLFCAHCAWFHEAANENRLNMLRHIQTALGEVQAALEIAEALPDETRSADQLKVALRELRHSLSRA